MALQAIPSQLSPVLVFVATGAAGGQAEKSVVQVLVLEFNAICRQDSLRVVAAIAGESCMLAVERETGLGVVEVSGGGIPFNNRKIAAVVLRMATNTAGITVARAQEIGV